MEQFKRLFQVKFLAFSIFLLFSAFCLLIFDLSSYHLPVFDGTCDYVEPDWFFGQQGEPLKPTVLGDKHLFEPGKFYELTTTLNYSGEGDPYPSAFITLGNYEARVFFDGEQVFRYTKEERGLPRAKSVGGAAFSIPLGHNCQGKQLTLILNTPMDTSSIRSLPGIQIGDYSAKMRSLFLTNLPGKLISAAITFVVIVLVLLGSPVDGSRRSYIHFSIFATQVVIYRAMQDLHFLYIWSSPYTSLILEFFSMISMPISLLLTFQHELSPHFKKTFTWMVRLSTLNFIGQGILHFTGIRDVVEMLTFTHIWILICAAMLAFVCLHARRHYGVRSSFLKLLPILLGACLDFITFYVKIHAIGPGRFFAVGNYVGLGLLASLILMVWEARKESEKAVEEFKRNQLLERIAYVDSLTGIPNRAAFSREISRIQFGIIGARSICVVAADINGLKATNDSAGHAAGDELICRAASLLSSCVKDYGTVFRTGGDEFLALVYDADQAQLDRLFLRFRQELKLQNQGQKIPLSIALGYAEMADNISESIRLADKRMYQNKVKRKSDSSYAFSAEPDV